VTTLHVTNGDSVVSTLRETSLSGSVLPWRDALHEGPLEFDPASSRRVRAAFLSGCGWEDLDMILADFERRDTALSEATHVVLWFEHDLYDQLQLLQALAQVRDDQEVELIQADTYLGSLDPAALEALWDTRRVVPLEARELARDAWRAICSGEIEAVLQRDTSDLPFLAPALRRLLEEREPLPRTKRQLLSALAEGATTPLEAFHGNQSREEAIFLGDAWAFRSLSELADAGMITSLPEPPPRGDYATFTSARVELTEKGRSALL
jgi:hypothetical protein